MHTFISFLLIGLSLCCVASAQTPAATAPTEAATTTPPASPLEEEQTQHIRTEDKGSRIDETRHRGQTTRTQVQPSGAPAYEITPSEGAHSAPTASPGASTSEGKRVWKVIDF